VIIELGLWLDHSPRINHLPAGGGFVEGQAERNPDVLQSGDVPTAVDNMRPGHRFVRTLSSSPIADGVTTHSIVAVQGDGPISSLGDGVVRYESAHLEEVASEKIVRSSHSTQGEPATIEEVRRILREHVAEWDRTRPLRSEDKPAVHAPGVPPER